METVPYSHHQQSRPLNYRIHAEDAVRAALWQITSFDSQNVTAIDEENRVELIQQVFNCQQLPQMLQARRRPLLEEVVIVRPNRTLWNS